MGLSAGSFLNENRFWTSPTSVGPIVWKERNAPMTTNAMTRAATMKITTDTSIASYDYPRPPRPVGRR